MKTKGIDVSHHNGIIDWSKVAKHVNFAIIRAGYGKITSQKDKQFESNYKGCKLNKIPVGCYWYSYAVSAEEARQEARTFLKVIEGKSFEMPVYYDIEEAKSLPHFNEIARAFCDEVEKAGYFVGIYSYKSAFDYHASAEIKNRYSLWWSHVDTENSYSPLHQYTWKGKVDGVTGDVAMNYCTKDFVTIIKANKLNNTHNEKCPFCGQKI